MTDKAHMEAIT